MNLKTLLFQTLIQSTEIQCLVDTTYLEARGEPREGRIAVASVILNRALKYERSICATVKRKHHFAYRNLVDKRTDKCWRSVAMDALTALHFDNRRTFALHSHFHNDTVQPRWALDLVELERIEGHRFYSAWVSKK